MTTQSSNTYISLKAGDVELDYTDSVSFTFREDAELLAVDILAEDLSEPPAIVSVPGGGNWFLKNWSYKELENIFRCDYRRTVDEQRLFEKATFFNDPDNYLALGTVQSKIYNQITTPAKFMWVNDLDGNQIFTTVGSDFQAWVAWALRSEPSTPILLQYKTGEFRPSADALGVIRRSYGLTEIISESMSGVKDWRGAVQVFNSLFLGVRINSTGDDFEFVDMLRTEEFPRVLERWEDRELKYTTQDIENINIQQDYYYADVSTGQVELTHLRLPYPLEAFDKKTDKEVSSKARAQFEIALQRTHLAKAANRLSLTIEPDFTIRPYDIISVKGTEYVVLQATTRYTGEGKPVTNIIAFERKWYTA